MHDMGTVGEERRPFLLRPIYDAVPNRHGDLRLETRQLNDREVWRIHLSFGIPTGSVMIERDGATLQEAVTRVLIAIQHALDEEPLDAAVEVGARQTPPSREGV